MHHIFKYHQWGKKERENFIQDLIEEYILCKTLEVPTLKNIYIEYYFFLVFEVTLFNEQNFLCDVHKKLYLSDVTHQYVARYVSLS